MIDLHSHSIFSDGSETPQHVVELAAEAGCTAVALTDHDGLEGTSAARSRAVELGITFIPGCEVSCTSPHGELHMLAYFLEPGPSPMDIRLNELRSDREARNVRLITRLNALGLPISLEEVAEQAQGSTIGRPHFAAVLVKNKAATSITDAFDRFLGKGTPGYISRAPVTPESIIEQVHSSGGISALAHPMSLGLSINKLGDFVASLADSGLSGLECYYGRYDAKTRRSLVQLARQRGLVPTGGSDFHGTYKPGLKMGTGTGDLEVPDEVVAELIERRSGIGAPA